MSDELYHYGVKGMKWGVRKKYYDNSKDVRVKAGTMIQRVSTSKENIQDFSRKHAYVATNRKDRKIYIKIIRQKFIGFDIKPRTILSLLLNRDV